MITVDVQTFAQRCPADSVAGMIFLDLQVGAFPDDAWYDFPVAILGFWMARSIELGLPNRRSVQWIFMDGPYCAILTKTETVCSPETIGYDRLLTTLLSVADSVIAHCEKYQLLDDNLEGLRLGAEQLKASIQRTEDSHISQIEIQASWTPGYRR